MCNQDFLKLDYLTLQKLSWTPQNSHFHSENGLSEHHFAVPCEFQRGHRRKGHLQSPGTSQRLLPGAETIFVPGNSERAGGKLTDWIGESFQLKGSMNGVWEAEWIARKYILYKYYIQWCFDHQNFVISCKDIIQKSIKKHILGGGRRKHPLHHSSPRNPQSINYGADIVFFFFQDLMMICIITIHCQYYVSNVYLHSTL